jgi:diguanylate cyclase (GGDEF)-like protein
MQNGLSVSRKIQSIAAMILIAVLALAGSAVYFANRTETAAHLLLENGILGMNLADRLDLLLEKHTGLVGSAPAELDRNRLAGSRAAILALNRKILDEVARGRSASGVHSESWAELARQFDGELPLLFGAGERVLYLADRFVQDQALETARGPYAAAFDRISGQLSAWRETQRLIVNDQVDRLFAISNNMVAWVYGGTAAILLAGSFGFAIVEGVLRRLWKIRHAMMRLAGNDIAGEVPYLDDRDEIGSMARAVQVFKCNAIRVAAQQTELRRANLRFETALTNMSQGLCLFDASDRLDVFNDRFCEIYGIDPGRMRTGMGAADVLRLSVEAGNHPGQTVEDLLALHRMPAAGIEAGLVSQVLGDGRVVAISRRSMRNGGCVVTYEDVTARRAAEAQVVYLARHDVLTGLPNRLVFNERLEQALSESGRDIMSAVLCLDLDRFKTVNDTLGHPVGDGLLRQVSDRLLACARDTDTVARFGGDEFAIVQAGIGRPEDAKLLAERILESIAMPFLIDGHQIVAGTSIGLTLVPADGASASVLLKNADTALYRAKADGRGTFCFFEADMDARLQQRRLLELDLRKGLASGEFELFYQPSIDLDQDEVSGFEALLRWRHPERGIVLPAEFIPIAEEIGSIVPLGEWALRRACADAACWPENIKIAVNLSPAQFASKALVETVAKALKESGLTPTRLELEITESVLLQDSEKTLTTLHRLRDLGVRISMDDFGAGYSSLSYLRSFPFDKIKIDRSFVRDLSDRADSIHIVRAVANLCSALGMVSTAEGVETEDQLTKLRAEGCVEVQGYLFGEPRPASEVLGIVDRVRNRGVTGEAREFIAAA